VFWMSAVTEVPKPQSGVATMSAVEYH
jgi:hypothetical protein